MAHVVGARGDGDDVGGSVGGSGSGSSAGSGTGSLAAGSASRVLNGKRQGRNLGSVESLQVVHQVAFLVSLFKSRNGCKSLAQSSGTVGGRALLGLNLEEREVSKAIQESGRNDNAAASGGDVGEVSHSINHGIVKLGRVVLWRRVLPHGRLGSRNVEATRTSVQVNDGLLNTSNGTGNVFSRGGSN